MQLNQIVGAFADCLVAVDKECRGYVTRKGRAYQPGIGPYPEDAAMKLVAACMTANGLRCEQFPPYPHAPRQKCDLGIGDPTTWAVEVKMGRFRGDNGNQTTRRSRT